MNNISLKDKVFIENQLIKVSNTLDKKLKDYFKKYESEKILLVNNTLIKKIKEDKELKNILNENNYKISSLNNGHVSLNLYITSGHGYSLFGFVKLCFNGGSYEDKTYYCLYVENYINIGELDKNILKKVNDYYTREPLNYENQKKLIKLHQEKTKELNELSNKIHHSLKDNLKYWEV